VIDGETPLASTVYLLLYCAPKSVRAQRGRKRALDIKKLNHLKDKQLDELKDRIAAFLELTEQTSFMCEPDKKSCLTVECPFRLEKNGHRHYLCLQIEDLIYTLDS
jgi:hypothetical protein